MRHLFLEGWGCTLAHRDHRICSRYARTRGLAGTVRIVRVVLEDGSLSYLSFCLAMRGWDRVLVADAMPQRQRLPTTSRLICVTRH